MFSRRSFLSTIAALVLTLASLAGVSAQATVAEIHAPGVAGISGPGEQLGLSPFVEWKTLTTEHFRITYPEGLHELAPIAAGDLEEAHRLLTPVMKWTPRFRTQVLLLDNSDFANGMAAATGRFGMVLWATPPDNWMSIAHYDDWFRMLAIHEYSHILNLDATEDFWKVLRIIAGDGLLPNSLWPSWMLEGLAVTLETSFTRAGRGRSSYYSMVLRGAEDAGLLADPEGLWRISGPRTEMPGGEVPYLFGNMLMTELASQDLKKLGELSLESASSLPWKLNAYSERVSGKDWSAHWQAWVTQARERARSELESIRAVGETPVDRITDGNYSTLGMAFSPDGKWMAYIREAMDRRQGVYLREIATDEETRISDSLGGSSLAFTADSKGLVFSRVDRNGLYNFYSDLWVHDLPTDKTTRLTNGARYRDPSTALAGSWVVYTVNETGRTSLARSRLMRDDNGRYRLSEKEVLFRPDILGRVSTPRISPDGSRIVFSFHENGKPGESIWKLVKDSVGMGEAGFWREKRVTPDGDQLDRFPCFDPTGALYFVSNRSGVDNVYRWNESASTAVPVTNVTTGLWLPAFSKLGRMAASHYRATGWDAVWVDLTAQPSNAGVPQLLPIQAPLVDTPVRAEDISGDAPVSPDAQKWETSEYSIFPSILPRTWSPFFGYGSVEGWIVGAALAGFDAIDLHRYFAIVDRRFGLEEWDADLTYSNRSLGAVWTLRGARRVNSLFSRSYTRKTEASIGLSLLYPRTFSAWNPSLELAWENETLHAQPKDKADLGSGELATIIRSPTFTANLEYAGTQRSRQAIWPEEGMNVRLGNRWTLGGWMGSLGGRRATTSQLLWTQSHFLHLGKHVVLSPRWQVSAANRSVIRLEGRSASWLDSLSSPDFDQLVIRGYPRELLYARQAGVGALDLRFPIRRVEKGWSTYPVFLNTVQGLGFYELSMHRAEGPGWMRLPSWGLGMQADLTLFYSVPVSASVQYHQGSNRVQGGRGEVFVDLRLGQLFF
jgi:hypothetical protein